MKGMELPINVIIVIAIALLVMVVIAAYFVTNVGSNANSIQLQQAKGEGCENLRTLYDCSAESVNSVATSFTDKGNKCSLGNVCYKMGLRTNIQCAKSCGCSTEGTSINLVEKCEIPQPSNAAALGCPPGVSTC